jgi:hypothetical protein
MENSSMDFAIAVVLATAAVTFVIWYLAYKRWNSKVRMTSMLQEVGLDPAIIRSGDHREIMKAVTQRCRKCEAEDVCERWLAGSYSEDNLFCPNAQVFRSLAAEQEPTFPKPAEG